MKSKRVKALILLVAVWFIAFIGLLNTWSNNKKNEADFVTAFASNSYLKTTGEISVYANYGSQYLSEEDKLQIIESIAHMLDIGSDIAVNVNRKEDNTGIKATVTTEYSSVTRNSDTDIRIVTIENKEEDKSITLEQYILVDIEIENSLESAVHYEKKIREGMEQLGISADVTFSLKGCMEGALSNSKKNEISERILEELEGEVVIGSRSDEMYIIYGYTENIDDYVVNGTTKSNINIAISYDKVNDMSWIYVATPILK